MHEKMLYIEALRKGFEARGRSCHVTNMNRLESLGGGIGAVGVRPANMPVSGPTLVLGECLGPGGRTQGG